MKYSYTVGYDSQKEEWIASFYDSDSRLVVSGFGPNKEEALINLGKNAHSIGVI